MDEASRAALEKDLRDLVGGRDYDAAATLAIRAYGPEIFGFLMSMHRGSTDASDIFATFSEDLWRGLPRFAWQCSFRTWAYTLARNASHRHLKNRRRRAQGQVPLSASGAAGLALAVRTATHSYLQTDHKDRFAALRESLPAEDQMLLILRVDRGLAWEELARILYEHRDERGELREAPAAEGGEDEPATPPSDEDLKRESARLRKRFQIVKEKLVTAGKRAGLFNPRK